MLKKQIIKKVFDNEFNINEMRNQILLKNERKYNKKMNKIYKFAVPTFLVLISSVIVFYSNNTSKHNDIKNNIHINKLENLQREMTFEVNEEEIENIPQKFDFILNINIPKDFDLKRKYNLYTRSNIEVNTFDILRDYVFEYKNNKGSKIVVSFSETGRPLKDYNLTVETLSKINNTDILISQYQNLYLVSFNYKKIFFAVETENISIEELTSLLESIIK